MLRPQALVLGAEAAQLLLGERELPLSGEGLFALVLEDLFPGAQQCLVDAEAAGGLRDGVALLDDKLDSLDLELGGVGASRSRHVRPPKSEFTLLTWGPLFMGRSRHFPARSPSW